MNTTQYTTTMSLLSIVEGKLPPGFRFHPRDDELVCDYLAPKISTGDGSGGGFFSCPMLIDIDLNKCEPWDLPDMALVGGKEWYFFSLKDRKYATGQRTNRATLSGYWKATGKDRPVVRKGVLVGMRKTLVFYQGRAPKGKKTEWVMHEFRMEGPGDPPKSSFQEDWVLCRVFYKSRGICEKPNIETSYEDTGSSSLPPLTESYITFNQTLLPVQEGFEQVPCFSSLPPNQASHRPNPTLAPHFTTMERCQPDKSLANLGGLPNTGFCLNTLSNDKKAITAVLDQYLTRFEPSRRREAPPNLAQGSSGSYLSETGLPSVWHPY